MKVNLRLAKRMLQAAEKESNSIGVPMVIAVVDEGGNLVAQQRMDDALLASIDISLNKAYTAVAIKIPTHKLSNLSQPGESLFGIDSTNNGRIVIFGGGYPIKDKNNKVIGGIGVSGGSVEQDMLCAEAGLAVTIGR